MQQRQMQSCEVRKDKRCPFFIRKEEIMAQARKDERGRALRKGEVQRKSDGRYMYTYTDPIGRRKFIYAKDLSELRDKERKLTKDQLDGLDLYVAGYATINMVFDRYISLKHNLREQTKSNYLYMWNRFVRDSFGKRKIAEIKNIPLDEVAATTTANAKRLFDL